jgi:hypothetical protein
MVLLCADDPWHTGHLRIGKDTVMGYVKVISLRRWNWLPWFKKTYYVPTCESVDVGGRLPMFSRYEDALKFLSIMEKIQ